LQDLDAVEKTIKEVLGKDGAGGAPPTPLPDIPWAPHAEPRCSATVDKEAAQPTLSVTFKCERTPFVAPVDMLRHIAVRIITRKLSL
jgi:hypothetical protein